MAGNNIDFRLLNRVMPHEMTMGRQNVENAIKSCSQVAKQVEAISSSNTLKAETKTEARFSIVVASRVSKTNAEAYVAELTRRGFKDARVNERGHVKVVMGSFPTHEEAMNYLQKLRANQEFSGAWVVEL